MGYARYIDDLGRPAGYAVQATCDEEGCSEEIDRGMAYRCDPDEGGCGRFFCYEHLFFRWKRYGQLCNSCSVEVDGENDD